MGKKIFQPTGNTITAVLFDMDGVLIDSIPTHLEAWAISFQEKNLPGFTNDFYYSMIGCKNSDLLLGHLKNEHISLSDKEIENILLEKEIVFRDLVEKSGKTTPGVKNWLNFLKVNEILCAVASSGVMLNIVHVLKSLDLSEYFTSILSADALPYGKPNPQVFQLAAASLGTDPSECLVIEDAAAGIEAAKSAGMACLAIATSYSSKELTKANLVMDSLQEKSPEEILV